MVAHLEDVERLFDAVKLLRAERRKMAAISEKAAKADHSKAAKFEVDLNWLAFHIRKIESQVHAAAVDCGFADLREAAHYQPSSVKLSGFHEYEFVPELPSAARAEARQS